MSLALLEILERWGGGERGDGAPHAQAPATATPRGAPAAPPPPPARGVAAKECGNERARRRELPGRWAAGRACLFVCLFERRSWRGVGGEGTAFCRAERVEHNREYSHSQYSVLQWESSVSNV
jgi:hypothetical protein